MKTKEYILRLAKEKKIVRSSEIARSLKISRQAVAQHLRELIDEGKLTRLNSTKKAVYRISKNGETLSESNRTSYALKNLKEDLVFQHQGSASKLKKRVSPNVYRILEYAFTEMLNNAIDHSRSKNAEVMILYKPTDVEFQIMDHGIGVFESVRKKFKLYDHFEAAEHLLKGKQTADPKRHSGQGIFFTSKIADRFMLESAKLRLTIDNQTEDIAFGDIRFLKGTRVSFTIKKRSKKELKKIFDQYSNSDYEFDKTKVTIHLTQQDADYVSRSQARRLVFGLDKFKRVVLDFKNVRSVSHSFLDEIFRVFKRQHPDIQVEINNASPSSQYLLKRYMNKPATF